MKTMNRITAICTIIVLCTLLIGGCGAKAGMDDTEMTTETATEVSTEFDGAKGNESSENSEKDSSPSKTDNDSASGADTEATGDGSSSNSDKNSSTASSLATPSVSGALHVEGTQLTDSKGNAIQLKGISTHGLAWYPGYVNEDCFRQLREEWNANVIRLAMYTAENGGYCTGGNKEELKKLVKNGVEYATENDMYVIIDWHILSDNNPNTYIEDAKSFFDEISKEYADYNNVLYEICNEPNGGTGWKEIKSYAEKIIDVIRANDEDGVILVGTPNWSQYVDQAAADPITSSDNIMYTLHFYAATHTDWLRDAMTAAIDAGLPIFVSEYGICDASGNGAIDENQANQWVSVMNEYGVSYVAWNLSNKNETSSILNSNCNKTSGFTESDLSSSGKWLYQMLTTGAESGSSGAGDSGTHSGSSGSGTSSAGASSSNSGSSSGTSNSGTNSQPIVRENGSITYTATPTNSWESDGKTFYQYDLTLENTSDTACNGWTITIKFNESVSLSQGWCGDFSAKDNVLTITSVDYNGQIPAGGTVQNIGFIVSGSNSLKIK